MEKNKFSYAKYSLDGKNIVVHVITDLADDEINKYGIPDELFDFIQGVGETEKDAVMDYLHTMNHLEELLVRARNKVVDKLYDLVAENEENEL